ncbi:GM19244 [Drosophila sechellia]|uniref:RNA helicase n=1 Tax=Drosophila sechellia TaxID=7238 RepID=B4I9Z3_DROSE|nr:GM19244 [Drosophila sechellia]
MKPIRDLQVPSFQVVSGVTTFTYASPTSGAASLDFLAHTLRKREANTGKTILICQHNREAERLKFDLAERDVNTILLPPHEAMIGQVLLLWSKGYINQALILCDDMLEHLGVVDANLVIHTTLPELNKFEERLKWLSISAGKAEMLVITPCDEENEKEGKGETELEVVQQTKPLKVDALNSKQLPEMKKNTAPTSSQDYKAEADAATPATIPNDNKEQEIYLSVEDATEKLLLSTSPDTSNSLDKSQLDQASSELGNTVPATVDASSPAAANAHAPGDSPFDTENPTKSADAEFQEWVKLVQNASKDMNLPPPPSVTIEEPLSSASSSDLRHQIDTTSLDSIRIVEDSPASLAVVPFSTERITYNNYGVLGWSRHAVVPCYNLAEAPDISTIIARAMQQMGVAKSRARAVQRFAWPHVSSGKSLLVVGNMQVGKTWSYLPTVCQRSHEDLLRRRDVDRGPTCIFVCPNQGQGKQIERWMSTLLRSLGSAAGFEDVVTHWDKSQVADIVRRLEKPVGILLTSVDLLLKLLTQHSVWKSKIFDAQAVKYIALDNLNDMVRVLPSDTMKLLKQLPKMFQLTQNKCQLLVSSRAWHTDLMVQHILPLMPDVLLLFDDALEASVYGGVQLDVRIVAEEPEKLDHLKALIAERRNFANEPAVVVCSTSTEVLLLRRKLQAIGVHAHTCESEARYSNVAEWRRQSPGGLLLVTDDVVPRLKCGKIPLLIHYSFANIWTRFKSRFSLFYANLKSPITRPVGQSVIFAKPTDVENIWRLCDFYMKHKLPRPIRMLEILSQRHLEEPHEPTSTRLCHQMAAFGDCLRYSCRYRHVMWRHEVLPPDHYPKNGRIRFLVLVCYSPAALAVRLSSQFPTAIRFLNFPMSTLGEQVQRHYEVEANRRMHPNPVPGEMAVLKNANRYERVDIVSVESDSLVVVQLLDTSTESFPYNTSKLYSCDEIFKDSPREAMDLRIIGLQPESLDRIWPDDARNLVRKEFFRRTHNKRSRLFDAVVESVIHRTIFVSNMYDDEGNDLLSFVTNRFRSHQEKRCQLKLDAMVRSSKDFPHM